MLSAMCCHGASEHAYPIISSHFLEISCMHAGRLQLPTLIHAGRARARLQHPTLTCWQTAAPHSYMLADCSTPLSHAGILQHPTLTPGRLQHPTLTCWQTAAPHSYYAGRLTLTCRQTAYSYMLADCSTPLSHAGRLQHPTLTRWQTAAPNSYMLADCSTLQVCHRRGLRASGTSMQLSKGQLGYCLNY
jgi:hypothetical protein